jgi:hypothetical protein
LHVIFNVSCLKKFVKRVKEILWRQKKRESDKVWSSDIRIPPCWSVVWKCGTTDYRPQRSLCPGCEDHHDPLWETYTKRSRENMNSSGYVRNSKRMLRNCHEGRNNWSKENN